MMRTPLDHRSRSVVSLQLVVRVSAALTLRLAVLCALPIGFAR